MKRERSSERSVFFIMMIIFAFHEMFVNFRQARNLMSNSDIPSELDMISPVIRHDTTTKIRKTNKKTRLMVGNSANVIALRKPKPKPNKHTLAKTSAIQKAQNSTSLAGTVSRDTTTAKQPTQLVSMQKSKPIAGSTTTESKIRRENKKRKQTQNLLIKDSDYIYSRPKSWDTSPIVIESHKLIFFTVPKVGCTVWKQLFRRMMGYKSWQNQTIETNLPHNPKRNGLKYLHNYPIKKANRIMTSPRYTRAIFVRDPKERFLSAYLDKVIQWPTFIQKKCQSVCTSDNPQDDDYDDYDDYVNNIVNSTDTDKQEQHSDRSSKWFSTFCKINRKGAAVPKIPKSLDEFLRLINVCENEHWRAQNERVEAKYWNYINFVGHMETVAEDAKTLLEQIGAWEEFGKTGWGMYGNQSIFQTSSSVNHATGAGNKLLQWYTPQLEHDVDLFFRRDYMNPVLNLTRKSIFASQ